jgi:hypothetical protein
MQMRDPVTEHSHIDVLGPGHVTQSPARPHAPPAHVPGLSVSKICHPRRVPPWFHEQMPQIRGAALASQRTRRDDMRDEHTLIFGNGTAWYQQPPPLTAPILANRPGKIY